MNKDEMIKSDRRKIKDLLAKLKRGELCTPDCYGCCGDNELDFAYCPDVAENFEKELANLGYQKVDDDEIVIKKSEYDILLKEYTITYDNAYQWGLRVGEENTAKEILQELYDEAMRNTNEVVELTAFEIKQLAKEKGIELE